MSKDSIRDINDEESIISQNDLEGFKCRTLLIDYSAIDFKSLFIAEQIAEISIG